MCTDPVVSQSRLSKRTCIALQSEVVDAISNTKAGLKIFAIDACRESVQMQRSLQGAIRTTRGIMGNSANTIGKMEAPMEWAPSRRADVASKGQLGN
jgi:hypothetical protein